MQYESYTEISDAIKDECNRTDLTDGRIATFIRTSERRIYRDLRVPLMEVKGLITSAGPDWDTNAQDTSRFSVPTNWLETILCTTEDGNPLQYVSQQEFRHLTPRAQSLEAIFFTREHWVFRVWPNVPDQTKFVLYYYAEPEAADPVTNNSPEIYHTIGEAVYLGAVSEAWRFFRDQEKHAYYRDLFAEVAGQIQSLARSSDISGSTLITKNPYN